MDMTDPDILKIERDGGLEEPRDEECLGECAQCGGQVTDDWEYWENDDGELFCSEECLFLYYGITHCD